MDTSAWVEFDRATGSPCEVRLTELIGETAEIAVTELVVMEVASGARTTQREGQLRRLLARFQLLPFDSIVDFDGAVHVYRTCRASAVTPRGLIDCMIAAVAARNGASILAHDRDFARVARVMRIDLDPGSLIDS
ncbi:MAG TPA: PIN domain nuclease [Candidatus Acidoferrales bacterium]|nr:PIN domain nuclease [Candidatus Acidoferrales bacterium]